MSSFFMEFKKVFQEQQHFLLMFPRQEQEEEQQQQGFFKDLWAELAVKNHITYPWLIPSLNFGDKRWQKESLKAIW